MTAPDLFWQPGVDGPTLEAIWAQRDTSYQRFGRSVPSDEMVAAAREGRFREAVELADPTERAAAYISVATWDPRQ